MRWSILKFSLLFIVSLSQIIILLSFLFYKNLNVMLGSWNNTSNLTIFLKPDSLDSEKEKITSYLKDNKQIQDVKFINREIAAKDFQKSIGEYATGLLSVDEMIDLVPETYEISLKSEILSADKIKIFNELKEHVTKFDGVEQVSFGLDWLKKFSKLDNSLKSTGLFVILVLLITMSFLAALMVRILIDDSKQEIEVYTLIGATRWSIYKMFLKEILITNFLSLTIAITTAIVIFYYLKKNYLIQQLNWLATDKMIFLDGTELTVFISLVFCFIGISSVISIRSTLKKLSLFSYD